MYNNLLLQLFSFSFKIQGIREIEETIFRQAFIFLHSDKQNFRKINGESIVFVYSIIVFFIDTIEQPKNWISVHFLLNARILIFSKGFNW